MAKAKKKTPSTEVAKKDDDQLPSYMQDYAGEGQEDISRDDITMPRLKLGQALSPEVESGDAETGDFIHNITREVVCKSGDSISIIPIAYSKEYILWFDRKGPQGGGIAARARKVMDGGNVRYMWDKPGQEFKDKVAGKVAVTYHTKKFIDEDGLGNWGSQILDDPDSPPAATEHFNYVVMLPDHDNQLIAISLSRTAAKKAREFNTMLKMGRAPTYARIYKMGSYMDRRDDDNFANYQFTGFDLVPDEELFNALRGMHESLKDKGINVDFSDDDGGGSRGTSSEGENGKF